MPDADDTVAADAVAALWSDYKAEATREARERLILHYSPLVKFVAGRVAAGLPQSIEQSDLVSYGIFGLVDAIEKFDPGRGFKFETYAISRIKGAIIDELRSIDWVPRSVRARARSIEQPRTPSSRTSCTAAPTTTRSRRSSTCRATTSTRRCRRSR